MGDLRPAPAARWIDDVLSEHEAPLLRYALRLTGGEDMARDVVQEAFLRLCAEDPERVADRVRPWLLRVCRQRAVDLLRKDGRMTQLASPAACMCPRPSPDAAVETRDTASHVLQLLAGLPSNQQEVVRLRFEQGLSYRDIAAVTELTVTNVGYLLHMAIKTLRHQLAESNGEAADRPAMKHDA